MIWTKKKRIYLDYASLAPRDEKLFSRLSLARAVGNPSSFHHEGVKAKNILEDARRYVANTIHAHADEIVFTSGGTEGDNLAVLGVLNAYTGTNIPHIVISAIEHSAILETVRYLEARGKISASYIPVDPTGVIEVKELRAMLRPETILVSVMLVNNELGTIEPIAEVAKAIRHFQKADSSRKTYPLLHVDACQAPNYIEIDVRSLHPDLMTLNGSKVYAGAGVGALFVKRGIPIGSIMHGGDQERGLRPGTENVHAIHEFAVALAECARVRESEMNKYDELRGLLVAGIENVCKKNNVPMTLLSDPFVCVPAIVNISFSGFQSELLVIELDAQGIAVSSKSACKTDSDEISHVIKALGHSIPADIGSIRFSLGRWTTKKDIQKTIRALDKIFLKYKM